MTGLDAALAFISAARADEDLHEHVQALGDEPSTDQIVSVAERAGYRFTAADLQRAHALDWRMRWARFHAS